MELDEFISKTLVQIIKGVKDAQKAHGELINPPTPYGEAYKKLNVSFDVAVTVEEKNDKEKTARISVLGNKLGGNLNNELTEKSVTKIKFLVPIGYGEVKSE